ncbi:MAG: hypothetical protein K2V38_02960, partial [Gemmataceae bacterium]|nr:hypothetical protein [Gemmataceae bacterium]
SGNPIADLTPLRGLKLEQLDLVGTETANLTGLQGMPLRELNLHATPVADLSPLKGLPLTYLNVHRTKVRDLSPLKGMPLTNLNVLETAVVDLSPLKGAPLVKVWCDYQGDRDAPVLGSIPTLKEVNDRSAADVLKGLPGAGPFTDADAKRVAALPAAEQIEEVRKELKKRNPGFDGTLIPTIEEKTVVGLEFCTDAVSDLSPVRGLAGLKRLVCRGTEGKGRLTDLSPLNGLPLTTLDVNNNGQLANLRPLKGMPLKQLFLQQTAVGDLDPLAEARLVDLNLAGTPVADLAPLKGMPLVALYLDSTKVADLTPLRGMPLKQLNIRELKLDPRRDHPVLRSLRALESINSEPVADFWKENGG